MCFEPQTVFYMMQKCHAKVNCKNLEETAKSRTELPILHRDMQPRAKEGLSGGQVSVAGSPLVAGWPGAWTLHQGNCVKVLAPRLLAT